MTVESVKASRDRWRFANAEKVREAQIQYRKTLKLEALARYGTACSECGFDNPLALCIDHIDDNGAEERRALGGQNYAGWNFYLSLRQRGWPEGYQTLCANCNLIKQMVRLGLTS